MTASANDAYFPLREKLRTLSEAEALALASDYVDQNCSALDAAFLKLIVAASGAEPMNLSFKYAALGSPVAQTMVGCAKMQGMSTEKNVPEALFWLRRAHNGGNTKASVVLCGAYLDGVALRRDPEKAVCYVAGAATRGDPVAQYMYANLLIAGDGIGADEDTGISWLRSSARGGYARAVEMLVENNISLEAE